MIITAIDPGNQESAYCVMDSETFKPLRFAKVPNEELVSDLFAGAHAQSEVFVIERVACYGMPVGREVFDTCEWIGQFTRTIINRYAKHPHYIFRLDEKQVICHDTRASDSNIRRALIDRFASHDLRNGKGSRDNPDFFYGFARDCWAAFAVGYTYLEKRRQDLQ